MPSKQVILVGAGLVGAVSLASIAALHHRVYRQKIHQPTITAGVTSRAAFDQWVHANRERNAQFIQFQQFLADNKVGGAVPAWQLMRADVRADRLCRSPVFLMPPQNRWGLIVPVLRFLKTDIVPRVGPIEVVSSYRAPQVNGCVGGVSKSRHMSFAAVDLIVPGQPDSRRLFQTLCAIHRTVGPRSAFGLGAYFNPNQRSTSVPGRFHVDVSGYRTWGYSNHADSSGCRVFNQLQPDRRG